MSVILTLELSLADRDDDDDDKEDNVDGVSSVKGGKRPTYQEINRHKLVILG